MAHVRARSTGLLAAFLLAAGISHGAVPGALDAAFGTAGKTTTNFNPSVPVFGESRAVALQSDGKIVLCGDSVEGQTNHFALLRYNADGTLDGTFGSSGLVRTFVGGNDFCSAVAVQSDGKIVAAGSVSTNGEDFAVLRYNSDGTLDGTFGTGGVASFDVSACGGAGCLDRANAIAIQSDGRIVIAGYGGPSGSGTGRDVQLIRLTTSGALDATFGIGGKVITAVASGSLQDEASGVAIDSQNRIVAVGSASISGGGSKAVVVRYNANGTLDTTFNGTGILVTGLSNNQVCFYPASDSLSSVAILAGDKLLVAGASDSNYHPDALFGVQMTQMAFLKLNADGTPDSSFGPGGSTTCHHNGDYIFNSVANTQTGLVLTNSIDGAPYPFNLGNSGGRSAVVSVQVTAAGKIIGMGYADTDAHGNFLFAATRLNANGTLDASFGCATPGSCTGKVTYNPGGGSVQNNANAGVLDTSPLERILITGYTYPINGGSPDLTTPKVSTVRLQTNGLLDTTFNSTGIVYTQMYGGSVDTANAIVVQGDGKAVLVGSYGNGNNSDFALARYNTDGTLDATFGSGGKAILDLGGSEYAMAATIQPGTGRILAAGQAGNDLVVAAFTSAGAVDASFGTSGVARATFGASSAQGRSLVVNPDGSIVVGGITFPGGTDNAALAKFTVNGTLDAAFGTGGEVEFSWGTGTFDEISALVLQPDGKIVAVGRTNVTSGGSYFKIAIARFTAAGALDTTFGCVAGSGCTGMNVVSISSGSNEAYAAGIQPDGKIVVAGKSNIPSGLNDFMAARFLTNGTLDATFGTSGYSIIPIVAGQNDEVSGMLARVDGRVVLFGQFFNFSAEDVAVAVLKRDGALDAAFNGGGTASFSVVANDFASGIAQSADGQWLLAGNDGGAADFVISRMFAPTHEPAYFRLVNDSGRSASDNITKNTVLNIVGTCFRGDTVQLTVEGSNAAPTGVCAANDMFDITLSTPLGQGSHSIGGYATNVLTGQSTNTYVLTVLIDTTPPAVPVISLPLANADWPTNGLISGIAEPFAIVDVDESGTTLCSGLADAGGNWSCQVAPPLNLGFHIVRARAIDIAGNVGAFTATRVFQAKYETATALASSDNPSTYGQLVTLTASVTSFGAFPTGSVQFLVDGVSFGPPQPLSASATPKVSTATLGTTNLTGGARSITASYPGNSSGLNDQLPSISPALTQTVNKATQTITFNQPGAQNVNDGAFQVVASASSGLGVVLSSAPQAICTVGPGNTVTLVSPGPCTVTADQPGDGNYLAAPLVSRTFTVRKLFNVVLEGAQQTPMNATTGSGSGTALVDPVAKTIALNLAFSGLGGAVTGAHLHGPAVRGSTVAAKFNLATTSPINNLIAYDPSDESDILSGKWYVNIETASYPYPNGEIRGQLDDLGATPRRLLTVAKAGIGSGTVTGTAGLVSNLINCGATCTYNAAQGLSINLTAAAGANSTFTGWNGGGCSGTGTCIVTMDAAKTVTATFTGLSLAVIKSGSGTGTVTSDVPGISCGLDCVNEFNPGTTIVLTAAVGANSTFGAWTSCPSASGNQCTVTLNSTLTVIARFDGPASDVVATSISLGATQACALTTAGGVKCWGSNGNGQLGDGTTTQRLTPVNVSGLASGVVAIAAGGFHTCALTTTGGVKCWGVNSEGEVGDGTTTQRLTPVDVSGLTSGVAAISAGYAHTCALTAAGGVKCWGYNGFGELGDNTNTSRTSPVDVVGLSSGVAAISAGDQHTCALTKLGGVKCWGRNGTGQLGDGTTNTSATPVDVSGMTSGVAMVSTGAEHACALTTSGGAKCWGRNNTGQLGDGTTTNSLVPTDVAGLGSGVAAIAAGTVSAGHSCALTTAGGVKCWGYNGSGQLGDGTTTTRFTPTDVTGLASGIAAIQASVATSCALSAGGDVKCWGGNGNGLLGDNSTTDRSTPAHVFGLDVGILAFAGGLEHSCALSAGGAVTCWGRNVFGALGDNSTTDRLVPVAASGLSSGVAAITAGSYHSCALTSGGGVKCWGANSFGQVGDATAVDKLVPTNVSGLAAGVAAIAAGGSHSCALTTGGGVKCWGYNGFGQVGIGNTTSQSSPVDVTGLTSGVVAIAAGISHTCALTNAGAVKCWGYNNNGQLGDGTFVDRTVPASVPGLTNVAALTASNVHTCALIDDGTVKCWGRNASGELGDGTTTSSVAPVVVTGLGGVVAISASVANTNGHTCALTSGGGLKCWGYNANGELGDGTSTNRTSPVDASGLGGGAVDVGAGETHSCAVMASGGVKCWGSNGNGRLGNNSTIASPTPIDTKIGPQSITFTAPTFMAVGGTTTLSATATSGLTVTFDSWTPTTCTVSVGGNLTANALGLCGVRASQAGNAGYFPAPQVLRVIRIVPTFTVTPSAGANGTISPTGVQTIPEGSTTQFTVTPSTGFAALVGGTCGGSLVGTTYTTNAITANCAVAATFAQITYSVTPSAGANGTISPTGVQTINHGATTQFTVTPSAGYTASVGGTCGGSLAGTTYTTNAIAGNCTVSATFTLNIYTVTPGAGANGTISPSTPQTVNHGATTTFTVTPSAGYSATVGGTCGGSLAGTTYTTNAVTANCTVSATFTINTYTVTPSAGANGTISPSTPQTVNHGSTATFTVTPSANYTASVGGTCGGSLVGTTYTTNAITGNCTVSATFALNTYTVTPSAGANGTISPSTPQTINHGSTATFTVTPSANYTASVGGTCGGSLVGTTYTTNAITANCTVTASFTINTYTVTPSAGANGTISPSAPQTVSHGATTSFTVTPSAGYNTTVGGSCGGSLVGNTYTTNAITANCTVSATFALKTYTVTPSAGANGTISPSTPQTINHGSTETFTVTPSANYTASVGGTCGGSLVGTTYTTNAITANCTVTASFTINTYTVTPSAGANGTISPSTPQTVNHGATTSFTVTPSTGYSATVGGTCGGSLVGNTYTTNAITGNCTVAATFTLNTYTVTPSAGANGTISPSTPQTINHGSTATFTLTPGAGFNAVVGGTCGGNLVGTTYTTNAITANCTVSATFTNVTFTVTPGAGANGTISPSTPQTVSQGATTTFTVTPSANYTASVGGTCGGSLVGNTYTTNAITASCTVAATFTLNTHTVTPSAGANGTISPSTPQTVSHGGAATFTVTPNAGFTVAVGGSCGGTLAGNTYSTSAITANCTVTASFSQNTYTVTASAGANGTIAPGGAQTVNHGAQPTFTVTPNAGYTATVAGTCGGALVGNTYTTNAVTASCTVSAIFTIVNPARMSNISTRMQVLSGNDVMIAGFIIGGPVPKTVVINVAGPNLVQYGILNALLNPKLTLVRSSDQAILATNDDWQSQAVPGDLAALTASGFQPNNVNEAAIIATLPPGAYTAIVEGNGATTGVGLVGVFEVDHPEVPLVNISTRGQVQTGNDVMIAGFIVQGTGSKSVVINVAGPSLVPFGITNALMNPKLTVVRSSDQTIIATNDDWQTQTNPADVAAIQATGFQPNNAAEPALLLTLPPGAYTAIVEGVGGTTGVGLVGVFAVP